MSDFHKPVQMQSEATAQLFRDKLYAFIFPNVPRTEEETEAFEQAVRYQYEHEATRAEQLKDLPEGVKEFSVGDFSMTFEKGYADSRLTKKTICPAAYGVLLRHGLLYRGVEGRR